MIRIDADFDTLPASTSSSLYSLVVSSLIVYASVVFTSMMISGSPCERQIPSKPTRSASPDTSHPRRQNRVAFQARSRYLEAQNRSLRTGSQGTGEHNQTVNHWAQASGIPGTRGMQRFRRGGFLTGVGNDLLYRLRENDIVVCFPEMEQGHVGVL